MVENSFSVKIHLYDLSQGMARMYSPQFLGKQIDGIWHTGIVVYGQEYFYGGGICKDVPAKTPYGNPYKQIDLGETEVQKELFHDFLQGISSKFTQQKYDIFKNNCNNFTDECCQFLLGQPLPSYITSLPETVLSTQFGKMIKPMIENLQSQMIQQTQNQQMFPGMPSMNELQNQLNQHFQNNNNNQYAVSQNNQSTVIEITNLNDYLQLINNNIGVIVDFFSFSCPPCMKIKPVFAQLANEYKLNCPSIKFCSVNVQQAKDIAAKFQISSIPTFYFIYNKEIIHKIVGANQNELQKGINQIKQQIQENNPNLIIQNSTQQMMENQFSQQIGFKFNLFNPSVTEFYYFRGPVDKPISKIKSILVNSQQQNTENNKQILEILEIISQNGTQKKDLLTNITIEQKTEIVKFLIEYLMDKTVKIEDWGAFLDLLKELVIDTEFIQKFTNQAQILNEKHQQVFMQLIIQNFEKSARGIKILTLRMFNNLFSQNNESGVILIMKYLRELIKLIEITIEAQGGDKVSLHTIVMFIYNIFQKQQNFKINEEINLDIREKMTQILIQILKQEAVNENNINFGLVMSFSQIVFKNESVLQQFKKDNVMEILQQKLKNNNDEQVKLAFEDLDSILKEKVN